MNRVHNKACVIYHQRLNILLLIVGCLLIMTRSSNVLYTSMHISRLRFLIWNAARFDVLTAGNVLLRDMACSSSSNGRLTSQVNVCIMCKQGKHADKYCCTLKCCWNRSLRDLSCSFAMLIGACERKLKRHENIYFLLFWKLNKAHACSILWVG